MRTSPSWPDSGTRARRSLALHEAGSGKVASLGTSGASSTPCRWAASRSIAMATVEDRERAGEVAAEEECGGEAVDGVAAVFGRDAAVAPAVGASLPLPAAARWVHVPL